MKNQILLFEEFLNKRAKDLFKVYLCIDPKYGHRWWSYKGFAGSNFFIQLHPDNYKNIDINPNFPILNYNSNFCKQLIKEGLIKEENVYNKPEHITKSGSKEEFHKLVDGEENIPKTTYTKEEALELGFPLIAKPKNGHSGIGIQIFKSEEEFNQADHSKFDVYSEFIDKKWEHRIVNFKGSPIFWMERQPMNDKAKSGSGKGEDRMMFKYIKRDHTKLPPKYYTVIEKFCNIFKDLPLITFDIMESKDGKLYIIESNTMIGVPFDSTIEMYKNIFKDFYGRECDSNTLKKLDELSDEMCKKTLKKEDGRFEINLD